jgi:hypothetical protein
MDHLTGGQDLMPPKGVPQAPFGNKIHTSTEYRLKLIYHVHPLKEAQSVIRQKLYQNVDIAVWAKVVAQNRPEEG